MLAVTVGAAHLHLLRPHVGEGGGQQLGHLLLHEGQVVGVGGRALGGDVPQGRLDDVRAHYREQVVQDLGLHLQARLVEGVCTADSPPASVATQDSQHRAAVSIRNSNVDETTACCGKSWLPTRDSEFWCAQVPGELLVIHLETHTTELTWDPAALWESMERAGGGGRACLS